MSLYLAVELCALAVPLAFSFDRKVSYYRLWPFLLPAIVINALIFIFIDIQFTSRGVWGFNPLYHSGIMVEGLPLEELLFFIIIPYCSLFIHYVFMSYFPDVSFNKRITQIISIVLIVILLTAAALSFTRSYTFFYSLLTAGILIIALLTNRPVLSRYYITFLIMALPFLVVNGILTGSFIEREVFWYDGHEISGIRLFTIPVEDALFGFSLILLNLLTAEIFRKLEKR